MLNNSCQVQQLGQILNHHMLAYLLIKWRQASLNVKNLNRWSGFNIFMTSFLFGLMANRKFIGFLKNLIKLILTWNLRMTRVKKRFVLSNENLYADPHIKDTECHQYLEYATFYPERTKKSITYSQTLRLSRLCPFQQKFEGRKRNLRSWFVKRRYPEEAIDKEISKIKFNFS